MNNNKLINPMEFSDEQLERIDEVYNATLDYCKILTENNNLQDNISFVGPIAEYAAECLTKEGNKVKFPYMENGIIHDFYEPEEKKEESDCKYILIVVNERDIEYPLYFKTYEDAHNKMCEIIADSKGVTVEDIKKSYLAGEEYDDETNVIEYAAYTISKNHDNVDCAIYKIPWKNGGINNE